MGKYFNNTWALSKKELNSLVYSPIIYVVMIFFLLTIGWFFMNSFFLGNIMSMKSFFELLPIFFSFIIPALTMRSFSEEYSSGSFELLMSFPLKINEVILGKYLANFIFSLILIFPTFLYPITLSLVGDFYWPSIITSYIGSLLLAGSFISIGIFASSLTKNQIVAWILGFSVCLFLTMIDSLLYFFPSTVVDFFRYISIRTHFEGLSVGVVDIRDVIYFCSIIFLFNYVTYHIISAKKG